MKLSGARRRLFGQAGSNRARILKNLSALTLLQGLNYVLPLISLPLLVRVLGIAEFGAVSFVRGVMILLFMVVDYGFSYSATGRIALMRDDARNLGRIAASVTAARLVVTLACAAFIAILCLALPRFGQNWRGFALSLVTVTGYALTPAWFFQGIEKMGLFAAANGGCRLVYVLLLVLLVHSSSDGLLVIGLEALSFALGAFVTLGMMARMIRHLPPKPTVGEVRDTLKEGWHYFLTNIAISTYTALITPFLGMLANDVAVGIYVAAERPIRAVTAMVGPLVQVLYPHMTRLAQHNRVAVFPAIRETLLLAAGVTGLGCTGIFVLAPFIVHVLYGESLHQVVPVLRALAFLPFLICCGSVCLTLGALVLGNREYWSRVIYTASAIGLCSLPLFVGFFGLRALGAALSGLTAELIVAAGGLYLILKMERTHRSGS